jgi:hypothetical protein
MLKFNEISLKSSLESFDNAKCIIFALSCIIRISESYGAYKQFISEDRKVDTGSAIETLLRFATENSLINDGNNVASLRQFLFDRIPNQDDVWTSDYPSAESAIICVVYLCDFILKGKRENVAWVGRHVYEAADAAAIRRLDLDLSSENAEEILLSSIEVQSELEHQKRDIETLLQGDTIDLIAKIVSHM